MRGVFKIIPGSTLTTLFSCCSSEEFADSSEPRGRQRSGGDRVTLSRYVPSSLVCLSLIAWFLTMCLPEHTSAAQIVVHITGTVNYGIDETGVFGSPNANLVGERFTLVYTFDDTKVQDTPVYCTGGVPCGSSASGTGPSSPGTAVLTIGNGSFRFGTYDGGTVANSKCKPIGPLPTTAQFLIRWLTRHMGFPIQCKSRYIQRMTRRPSHQTTIGEGLSPTRN